MNYVELTNHTNFSLDDIEKLKRILGTDYDEVSSLFRDACISTSYKYKIFLTRRAYVLFRIFRLIFSKEDPSFKVVGEIYNTHSIYRLKKRLEHDKNLNQILLFDDIVINGRTMKRIYDDLLDIEGRVGSPKAGCIVFNQDARCISKDLFVSYREIYEGEWKELSDKLTAFIIASNIGYTSFTDSRYLDELLPDSFFDRLSCKEIKDDILDQYGVRSRTIFPNEYFSGLSLQGADCFIRVNEKKDKTTIIPFVLLPSVKRNDVFEYCRYLLAEINEENSISALEISKDDIDDETAVFLYLWTTYRLGEALVYKFLELVKNVSIWSYPCSESFCVSYSGSNLSRKENIKIKNFIPSEVDVNLYPDLVDCRSAFAKAAREYALDKQDETTTLCEGIIRRYLYRMKQTDDQRAVIGDARYGGIRPCDIIELMDAIGLNDEFTRADYITAIVKLWDLGKSSLAISTSRSDDHELNMIGGFIKHGEQAYSIYLKQHSLFLIILNYYFQKNGSMLFNDLVDFANLIETNMKLNGNFIKFVSEILNDPEIYDDLLVVKPNSETFKLQCLDEYIKFIDEMKN